LLIATPNIAVDRTVRLPELRPGSVQRPSRAVVTAGGKGLNVSRVAAAFGRRARLVSFLPQTDAALTERLLAAEPVDFTGIPVPGEARVATILLEDSGRVTVLNEPGPSVPEGGWERYEKAVADELARGRHRTLVCSGSLPPGVPDDAYARLVEIGHRAGVRVVVDASRAALAAVLPAGPDVVTPNLAEAESVLHGHAHESVADTGDDVPGRAGRAVLELCRLGARSAAVTAGAAGAAYGLADGDTGGRTGSGAAGAAYGRADGVSGDRAGCGVDGVVWVPTVPVRVANPIGAGDSFVAGLVEAFEAGRSGVEAVVFAVATATASVEQELAGGVDPARARELAARVAAVMAGAARTGA
jgi:1-phosphofructokinase family hexose kinase